MRLPEVSIDFSCADQKLQSLWDSAVRAVRGNLRVFGRDTVLTEGGGYSKIWLETQPMGGAMFALWHPEAAFNNSLLFLRHQRADGRLPGSIRLREDGAVEAEFDKLQGFCFPAPALDMYYFTGEDPGYLELLRGGLERFLAWLNRTRRTEDGLYCSFCVYDTGEDHAVRYGDAPRRWTEDAPPRDADVVPMASMDVTSYAYACCAALAEIARIRGSGEAEAWQRQADDIAARLKRGLWDEARGSLFDRDRDGRRVDVLGHNPLRCMYWGSLSREMADTFVRRHLLNPAEFWTPLPLPSVAANDPAFRNAPENNWSGQCEGLTYQRAIRALENYGWDALVPVLGRKLFAALDQCSGIFPQQFDPFTGAASLVARDTHRPVPPGQHLPLQDDYGPTALSALTYMRRMWGIAPVRREIWWSAVDELPFRCAVTIDGRRLELEGGLAPRLRVDGGAPIAFAPGQRLITDKCGRPLRTVCLKAPDLP